MVGNFHEGFIFVFFTNQEPFVKIKTTKFLLSTCKVSELCFNPAYFKLSSHSNSNRSLSASVPLTAIAQATQEIEALRMHRCTTWTAAQGQEWKELFLTNVLGMRLLFFATLEQRAEIAISLCKQF